MTDEIKKADEAVQAEVKKLATAAYQVWVKQHIVIMACLACTIVGVLIGAIVRHL